MHLITSRLKGLSLIISLVSFLVGCGNTPVKEEKDSGPAQPVSVEHIPEPIPRVEPRTAAGNSSPYTVLGKTYKVIKKPEGYREKGIASWYGRKFHGKRTANGEIYDMYGMTAAHKTLPIPSYVRVTNVDNRRSIIVRVNDRGPFHGDRIIDLTYTAAKKLGFENRGVASVAVEYINPLTFASASIPRTSDSLTSGEPKAPAPLDSAGYAIPNNTYLQVGAFSNRASAEKLKQQVASLTQYPVLILESKKTRQKLFRVRVGPMRDNFDLMMLKQEISDNSLPEPHVVYQ